MGRCYRYQFRPQGGVRVISLITRQLAAVCAGSPQVTLVPKATGASPLPDNGISSDRLLLVNVITYVSFHLYSVHCTRASYGFAHMTIAGTNAVYPFLSGNHIFCHRGPQGQTTMSARSQGPRQIAKGTAWPGQKRSPSGSQHKRGAWSAYGAHPRILLGLLLMWQGSAVFRRCPAMILCTHTVCFARFASRRHHGRFWLGLACSDRRSFPNLLQFFESLLIDIFSHNLQKLYHHSIRTDCLLGTRLPGRRGSPRFLLSFLTIIVILATSRETRDMLILSQRRRVPSDYKGRYGSRPRSSREIRKWLILSHPKSDAAFRPQRAAGVLI